MTNWKQLLPALAGLLLAVYLLALGLLFYGQERVLFRPQTLPADYRFVLGDDVHELAIEVPGARLSALHLRLPRPKGLVFFLHGNGGNLDNWFVNTEFYRRANYDLFMLDYRGYGKSSGHIDGEAQLHADVAAAWARIAPRYAGLPHVIYGRSLGTGLAAALAAEVQPELTVLVSPFFSMTALMREQSPPVPTALLRYPLRSDLALPRIAGPLLLVHGAQDTLIPPRHSERLLPLARQSRLALIPQAGHNDLQDFEAYRTTLREALDAL